MPKSANQKLKLLYMAKIFLNMTDENHPMSLEQIKQELAACGIDAERKSLYDDLDALRTFGIDVQMVRDPKARYFVADRIFELPELKILVDSVQANQFLTEKKTLALIKKLEKQCSKHEAQLMHRQVYVANRIKTMNESIFYNVDSIQNGIALDRQIAFKYFELDADKKKQYRHSGERYRVSPFALTLSGENYYLLGYDSQVGVVKHYRVDKMDTIQICDAPREGKEAFREIDLASYTKHTFGMFGGEKQRVTLEFSNGLAGVVIDRFGKDVPFIRRDDGHFIIHVEVTVSPQFYGWLFALGSEARILEPERVAEGMKGQLCSVAGLY
jgi:predicted DNA-binding transcriptional regulator YafY